VKGRAASTPLCDGLMKQRTSAEFHCEKGHSILAAGDVSGSWTVRLVLGFSQLSDQGSAG
jgi:hypothetical protein